MIPLQNRSVDPGSSFDSDNVNKLSRIVTGGEDQILKHEYLLPTLVDFQTVNVTAGLAIKDDVVIQFLSSNDININEKIGPNFSNIDGTWPSPFPSTGVVYIVLKYVYQKVKISNVAELKYYLDITNFKINEDYYFYSFLGCADYSYASNTFTLSNLRLAHIETDTYTLIDGENWDGPYPLIPIDGGDYWASPDDYDIDCMTFNFTPGYHVIEERHESNLLKGKTQILVNQDDFDSSIEYTVNHMQGKVQEVQIIDVVTGEMIIPKNIIHSEDLNSFVVSLYEPKTVYIVYI